MSQILLGRIWWLGSKQLWRLSCKSPQWGW